VLKRKYKVDLRERERERERELKRVVGQHMFLTHRLCCDHTHNGFLQSVIVQWSLQSHRYAQPCQ
jgi:hypothetical protein